MLLNGTTGTPLDLSIGTAVYDTPIAYDLPQDILTPIQAGQTIPASQAQISSASGFTIDTKTLIIAALVLILLLRK